MFRKKLDFILIIWEDIPASKMYYLRLGLFYFYLCSNFITETKLSNIFHNYYIYLYTLHLFMALFFLVNVPCFISIF